MYKFGIRPYGLWDSPLSPSGWLEAKALGTSPGTQLAPFSGWKNGPTAMRWWSRGRGLDAPRDLNVGFSARSGIGYGGGEFTAAGGHAFFVDAETGQIFRQPFSAGLPQPVTPAFGGAAAPVLSPDGRWLLYVHTHAGVDSLAIVDARGLAWPGQLVTGDDFYMQPCWHPAGDRIAWIAWNHPQMPWDGARLYTGRLLIHPGAVPLITDTADAAGEDGQAAVFQPRFSPDGRTLAYVSDAEGFWQIYLIELASGEHRRLADDGFEYGLPAWVQGMRTYEFSPDGKMIFAVRHKNGFASLVESPSRPGLVRSLPSMPATNGLSSQRSARMGSRWP